MHTILQVAHDTQISWIWTVAVTGVARLRREGVRHAECHAETETF